MRKNVLTQQVNFALSVTLIGSAALLGIVLMLKGADIDNPIMDHMIAFAAESDL